MQKQLYMYVLNGCGYCVTQILRREEFGGKTETVVCAYTARSVRKCFNDNGK